MNDIQIIQQKIHEIRGQRVILDFDLAELYQVTTGNLNKAVKRNIRRFPPDFMFQLTKDEFEEVKANLIFHFGISRWGGTRKLLENQNDINEDTRAQLELINQSLAALQTTSRPPRRPIVGFSVPKDKE
ncbi:MAG: ORF6N domain-containing protein [Bacteroidaceae bacterium]|nr:ORF6N domain-containing protein [Bacteroidaceae bacterium]